MLTFFNGTEVQCTEGCTLADLLDHLGVEQTSCATAVNSRFVPRNQRGDTRLAAGDHIMTFEPITGG
jgi:sulfur carrier protein